MDRTTLTLLLALVPLPALAETSWDTIRTALWEDRPVQDGTAVIDLDAPYRTFDDARTVISALIEPPTGLSLGAVSVILDENPMPVSAVFTLDRPQTRFHFDVTLRINGPTPLHVVAETTDGQLFAVEGFVKTSGTGACAAPPGTDPVKALETLGEMTLSADALIPGEASGSLRALTEGLRRLGIDLSHPSHSGMQKDQISLLWIPMRYAETLDIDLGGKNYAEVTGSISLSENPSLGLSVPPSTQSVTVTMTDTDGTVTTAEKSLAGY